MELRSISLLVGCNLTFAKTEGWVPALYLDLFCCKNIASVEGYSQDAWQGVRYQTAAPSLPPPPPPPRCHHLQRSTHQVTPQEICTQHPPSLCSPPQDPTFLLSQILATGASSLVLQQGYLLLLLLLAAVSVMTYELTQERHLADAVCLHLARFKGQDFM